MMGLQIKPSEQLCTFIKSLPEDADLTLNLQKLKSSDKNAITVSNADVRWISNYLRQVVIWLCFLF